jgi:hypothetical protein
VSENLTKEAFRENLNTKFRVPLSETNAVDLELIEVVETVATPVQDQFSIFFRGPLEYFFPQSIYHIEHEKMGEMDIFIVPVAKGQDSFRYEAVFNYLRQGE